MRGFLHISPPSHEQNIVHPSLEQLQEAFLHPDVLQLQWISRSMSVCQEAQTVYQAVLSAEEGYPGDQPPSHT